MKKIPQKKDVSLLPIVKESSKPINKNLNKFINLNIREFYLEIFYYKPLSENSKLSIHKKSLNSKLFNILSKKINGKYIKCLLKFGFSWFTTKITKLNDELIELLLIKKIQLKENLNKINYLVRSIQKMKEHGSSEKIINKYIYHFFDYHFFNKAY